MDAVGHNRRVTDTEVQKISDRVDKIEADLVKLQLDVERQVLVNLRAHEDLLKGITEIRRELVMHTRAEEAKFDTIILNQDAQLKALENLKTETAPAVHLTNTAKYLTMAIGFIKDTIVPILAGGMIVYGALTNNFRFPGAATEHAQQK